MPNSYQPTFRTMHVVFHIIFFLFFSYDFLHNFLESYKMLLNAHHKLTTLQLPHTTLDQHLKRMEDATISCAWDSQNHHHKIRWYYSYQLTTSYHLTWVHKPKQGHKNHNKPSTKLHGLNHMSSASPVPT